MAQDEWQAGWVRCVGLVLNGRTLDDVNAVGEPIHDDSFLLLLNPHHEAVRFTLPPARPNMAWDLCIDTSRAELGKARRNRFRKYHQLIERSLAVFKETPVSDTR
jgi:glycogen operon protein